MPVNRARVKQALHSVRPPRKTAIPANQTPHPEAHRRNHLHWFAAGFNVE